MLDKAAMEDGQYIISSGPEERHDRCHEAETGQRPTERGATMKGGSPVCSRNWTGAFHPAFFRALSRPGMTILSCRRKESARSGGPRAGGAKLRRPARPVTV